MDNLLYVEREAEVLQFCLWYYDYVRRWAKLSAADKAAAPKWESGDEHATAHSRKGSFRGRSNLGSTFDILDDEAGKSRGYHRRHQSSATNFSLPRSPEAVATGEKGSCERRKSSEFPLRMPTRREHRLTGHSQRAAVPRRGRPDPLPLHPPRIPPSAVPLPLRPRSLPPRCRAHHPPVRPPPRLRLRRRDAPRKAASQLHQLEHFEQQPAARDRHAHPRGAPSPRHLSSGRISDDDRVVAALEACLRAALVHGVLPHDCVRQRRLHGTSPQK